MIPEGEWKWYGTWGHFICGKWCRFHLYTQIGKYLVSTVGEYVHPRHGKGSESLEAQWNVLNPHGEEIGFGRFYETMVFPMGTICNDPHCNCATPLPTDWSELDTAGYKNRKDAQEGHYAMCRKWAQEGQ